MRYAYPSTPHIASFKSFGARCCSGSPAWSKALTGVSFTRAYDDEGGTEDTTARFHRQHYQLLPRGQWEGEGRGMGTSDEGAGEKQNQDVFEWCEEDRCRLYEANEGWRSDDRDFTISQSQRGVYIPYAPHREEDDGNPGQALWQTIVPEVVWQDEARKHELQRNDCLQLVQCPGHPEVQAPHQAEAHAAPPHKPAPSPPPTAGASRRAATTPTRRTAAWPRTHATGSRTSPWPSRWWTRPV